MPGRVLVVDDDPVIVRLLEVNLRLEGYEVSTASRGEEALERAAEVHPDVIVLDVMMPGLDGWETCRRLREQPEFAETPVVFLSARAQDDDRSKGLGLGRVEYVTKPFDPVKLMELVGRLLGGGEDGTTA
jgi:DNA-binding response OmpR family regulator